MGDQLWADPEVFRHALAEKGWSKAELARQTDMNSSTISIISNNRAAAYPSQAERICKALGVKQSKLFPVK